MMIIAIDTRRSACAVPLAVEGHGSIDTRTHDTIAISEVLKMEVEYRVFIIVVLAVIWIIRELQTTVGALALSHPACTDFAYFREYFLPCWSG